MQIVLIWINKLPTRLPRIDPWRKLAFRGNVHSDILSQRTASILGRLCGWIQMCKECKIKMIFQLKKNKSSHLTLRYCKNQLFHWSKITILKMNAFFVPWNPYNNWNDLNLSLKWIIYPGSLCAECKMLNCKYYFNILIVYTLFIYLCKIII